VEILSSYDFTIEHLECRQNPACGSARRSDYKEGFERPKLSLFATLAVPTVEPYNELLVAIKAAQASNSLAAEVKRRIVNTSLV